MPECVGYESFIYAEDDTLPNYTWDFGTGIIDSTEINAQDGTWGSYVHWDDGELEHYITLTATNSYGCVSVLIEDTVREPDPLTHVLNQHLLRLTIRPPAQINPEAGVISRPRPHLI